MSPETALLLGMVFLLIFALLRLVLALGVALLYCCGMLVVLALVATVLYPQPRGGYVEVRSVPHHDVIQP